MASRWGINLAVALVVSSGWAHAQVPDNVQLANENGTEESRFIVWAHGKTSQASGHSVVGVGDFSDDVDGQLVAFTVDRPPALLTGVSWTAGSQFIPLTYPDVYEIPIKFWILCAQYPCKDGIPSTKRANLGGFIVWANERLRAEHVGIKLVKAEPEWISDQTSTTGDDIENIELLRKFSRKKCDQVLPVMQGMKTEGAFNIYVVQLVDWRLGNGHTCHTDDSAVVGRDAIWGTMLHEMGHDLRLAHVVKTADWFDDVGGEANVMCKFSDSRRYFTEGQVFRMHFEKGSGLTGSLSSHVHPPITPMKCPENVEVPCPYVQTMLWPDN